MRWIGEAIGAVVLAVLAVVCWHRGVLVHVFSASSDGRPAFEATRYSGSWIALAAACVLAAILLAMDAIRTVIRKRSHTR